MIIFEKKNHLYLNNINEKYTSATTFLKNFTEKKDWSEIANQYFKAGVKNAINKFCKKEQINKKEFEDIFKNEEFNSESLLKYWDKKGKEKADIGTYWHKIKENNIDENETDEKISFDLENNSNLLGEYKEFILYSHRYKIAGQSDKITIFNDKSFIIEDYKFIKELNFNSYIKRNQEKEFFLAPINHIEYCNGNLYTLQLSLYAYLLEEYGYKCKNLFLLHNVLNEKGTEILKENKIEVNYLKKEIKNLLNFHELKNIILK